jgi:hypothetical protein
VAADAELRRRHPEQSWPPLRSAEAQPVIEDEHGIPTAGERSIEAEQRITGLAAQHREFAAKLAERQSLMTPAEDPDFEDLGPAFPAWTEPDRDAILQPPRPQIQPSERLLELTAGREPNFEAAD